MNFVEYYQAVELLETHKLTTGRDVQASGSRTMSQFDYVNTVHELVIGKRIKYNQKNPQAGSLVLDRNVLAFHVGNHWDSEPVAPETKYHVIRIRTYLYDPSVAPVAGLAGEANYIRGLIRLFYDYKNQTGITPSGQEFRGRRLLSTIAHELTHITDPQLSGERDKYFSSHQDYFGNKDNWNHFWNDTAVEKDDGEIKKKSDAEYAQYIDSPQEKKAWAAGAGFEMADRVVGGGTATRRQALDRLRGMGTGDYVTMQTPDGGPSRAAPLYAADPRKAKRMKRAAWDYLGGMTPEEPQDDRMGRGTDYYAKLRAENPQEYARMRQKVAKSPSLLRRIGRFFGF